MNDNPIGWLETTDKCNVHCLGCYRQMLAGHKPLEEVKQDILFLKQWRNVHNISIAGGEPLLHPHISEIVAFIRENDMEPVLLSNGHALTREMAAELNRAGLRAIAFHVDSQQKRSPRWNGKTEAELNELRQELMEIVNSVPGMTCNFGMTVYRSNLPQIADVVRWCNQHIDKVFGIVLITFRAASMDTGVEYYTPAGEKVAPEDLGYATTRSVYEDSGVTAQEVYNLLRREFPHYQASAYLNGTQRHDSFKWLLAVQVGLSGGTMLGSLGPRMIEAYEVAHHWFRGKYVAHRTGHRVGSKLFLARAFDPMVRKLTHVYRREVIRQPRLLFSKVCTQALGIIQAPDLLPDGRTDMCDACPDMCVHEGTLVHSCRWDEWRLYGGYLRPQLETEAPVGPGVEEQVGRILEEA
jgi:hypothetical protein